MPRLRTFLFLLLTTLPLWTYDASAQQPKKQILKSIVSHYYKNEKPIYKGRNQLLFTFCDQPPNNAELFETINSLKLPPAEVKTLRQKISQDTAPANWKSELGEILSAPEASTLKIKVNECLNLEEYQEKQKRFNLNNQRLMIVYRPLFYNGGKSALVKVVFYRSIEHNSGSVLKLELQNGSWAIKEFLNPWST